MQDLVESLEHWLTAGRTMALALVVGVSGTSPRPLGAKLLVTDTGEMAGSVSGGCVEAAVAQEAQAVMATGLPRVIEYGIADELAQSVGLTCGGVIQVLILPLSPALAQAYLRATLEQCKLSIAIELTNDTTGAITVWSADDWHRSLDLPPISDAWIARIGPQLAQHQPQRVEPTSPDHPALFLDTVLPAPRLVMVGAVHIAIPLVTLANSLGFRSLVIDARSAFATPARFGHATALLVGWPADILATLGMDDNTYVVTLTHDDKLDLPALDYALRSQARYVGALGSKRTLPARLEALRELGVTPDQLARLHAPVGLDLGGRLPEEIALAIMAEIVAVRNEQHVTTHPAVANARA